MPRFRFRLVPRDEGFFELFVRQATNIETGARVLYDLIAAYDDAPAKAARLRELEHEGDEMTHDILRRLNTVFVTPIDHDDIHVLTTTLDDVLDHMEAAADLFVLHKIEAPLPEMKAQADVLVRTTTEIRKALALLPRYQEILPHTVEVDRLENEGDRVYRQAVADLFGGDKRAMDVLKAKDIIDELEAAIDKLEDVSDVLEAISLKQA
jgi:hypothetical protein